MDLKSRTISGTKWTTFGTFFLAATGLIKISVLARFLEEGDFGLMALVTMILGFMNLFMDMGLTSAILFKQEITRKEYSSLYWINVVFSLILFLLITLVSPIVASFYEQSELTKLIPLMTFSIILSALGRQFRTIEQKELNFRYIAIVDVVASAIGLILSVILAIEGFGVYALVFGALVQHFFSNALFFIRGILRFGLLLHFKFQETIPFLKIGIFQVGSQMLNYFNRDLDIIIIGKLFGVDILGGYSLAKELIRRPLQIINPIVNKIGVSILPRFQNNKFELRRKFSQLIYSMGSLNGFIYGIAAIFAPYLVFVLYGSDFLWIVPYVQLFAVVTYLRSMAGNIGILVIATGKTKIDFYWNVLSTLIMPLAIVLGAQHSVELVILMLGIVQLLMLVPGWYMFYKRLIQLKFVNYFDSHISPLLIGFLVFSVNNFFSTGIIFDLLSGSILLITLVFYCHQKVPELKLLIKNKNI